MQSLYTKVSEIMKDTEQIFCSGCNFMYLAIPNVQGYKLDFY